VTLMAASVMVTVAPEIAASEVSSTVPLIEPKVCWARRGEAKRLARKHNKSERLFFLKVLPFKEEQRHVQNYSFVKVAK